MLFKTDGESSARNLASMGTCLAPVGHAGITILQPPTSGPSFATASSEARTALTRRRSQRMALGKLMSSPRSASAAASMLRDEDATITLPSMALSKPGRRAARKSGNRLNVQWPSGQYHRAMRTPGEVRRS